jgi:ribosomal protein S27E
MKRYADKPYGAFAASAIAKTTGLEVRCPDCGKIGIVKMDFPNTYFQCISCGKRHQRELGKYTYRVSHICSICDHIVREDVIDEIQQQQRVLNIRCPFCKSMQQAEVQKNLTRPAVLYYVEVRNGVEPLFGYPLYYQTSFGDEIIWALNREHLIYLIEYIEADLREDGETAFMDFPGTKTQSDRLPKFMKLAKNRQPIVKLLKRMLGNG